MSTIRASVWVFIMPIPSSWTNVTFRRTVRPFTPIWDITSWSIITWVTWGIQSFRHGNSLRVRVSRWSTIGIGVSIGWGIIIRITWVLTISNLLSKLYISRTLNTQMDLEHFCNSLFSIFSLGKQIQTHKFLYSFSLVNSYSQL